MPVARMPGEKWMPGRLSCLSLSRDQALCPRGPERDGSVALPSGGGLLAWAAAHCFAELVGGGRVFHPPPSGGLREVFWAPQATHVPSPGPGARRGGGPLPSWNTPFSSPNPMGNRGPTLQTHLTLSRQLPAPLGLPHQYWVTQLPDSRTEGPMWHSGLQAAASTHGASWNARSSYPDQGFPG